MNDSDANRYFFKNAFPALTSDKIGAERYKELEDMFNSGESPSKKELYELFPHACNRVEEWTVEGIRRYWWRGHQELINAGKEEYEGAPSQFKIQCSVRPGVVTSAGKVTYEVQVRGGDKERVLVPDYLTNLKEGEHVTVHLRRASEKITLSDYDKIEELKI